MNYNGSTREGNGGTGSFNLIAQPRAFVVLDSEVARR